MSLVETSKKFTNIYYIKLTKIFFLTNYPFLKLSAKYYTLQYIKQYIYDLSKSELTMIPTDINYEYNLYLYLYNTYVT